MSSSHSPPNEREEVRRAACDECRSKKARCTGEIPTCSRCAERGEYCSYSLQKPRGRPKRPRHGVLARDVLPENHTKISEMPNISGPSPHSYRYQGQVESVGDPWGFVNPSLDGQFMSLMGDIYELPHTYDMLDLPVGSGPADWSDPGSRQTCDCILSLSQMLNRIREDNELAFPLNVRPLREALRNIAATVDCQVCPRIFVSAMQNCLLLCTGVMSVAHGYIRVAKQIDMEAIRCSQTKQMKVLEVSGSSGPSTDAFVLEVSPGEWKKLAMKMVRAEVFGVADGSHPCFISMVDKIEQRQKSWHASPPGAFFPDVYCEDDNPACLRLLKATRGIIASLDSSPRESPSPPAPA
ncbi:hypothetical protein NCS52_00968200 [Fusarium sp. LHS14.1]|nr:hypothetical protein NCS52_00968200 [Fusarium sp. LHS14.1]